MPYHFLLKYILGITENSGSNKTGHKIHRAQYMHQSGETTPGFYKENKNGDPDASIKEVAFSELARLFMLPHSTPRYHLVASDKNQQITGVISEHIQLSIAKKEPINQTQFKSVTFSSERNAYLLKNVIVNKPEDIPATFLNTLPHGFFAALMTHEKEGKISVDMESLANIFVIKYVLEEDDLHKGNIGFYTTVKDNKPHMSFFNIDHDLMLSESIMSFINGRIANWSYGDKAFNPTRQDLINFPDLKDSENHYWPTRKRVNWPVFDGMKLVLSDDKRYSNDAEREAFKQLKDNPEFQRYKWKCLLKSILIPDQAMQRALQAHLNPDEPLDAKEINLITQALNERIIKLRAILFSIPEFREYLTQEHGVNDIQTIQKEIKTYLDELPGANDELKINIQKMINNHAAEYLNFCNPQQTTSIIASDTPLHIAIRLGDYRFDESQKAFSEYLNSANENGEYPIDIAAQQALTIQPGLEDTNPGKDPLMVIKYLLAQGAIMTPKVEALLEGKHIDIHEHHFPSRYYKQPVNNYADLKAIITDIGKDSHLSLKTKKIISVNVIKQHLATLNHAEQAQFKIDLNGTTNRPIAPQFLFLSQLRSSLWIVRAIRGPYGNSSTKMELNHLLTHPKQERNQDNLFSIHPGKTKAPQIKNEEQKTSSFFSP